MTMMPEKRGSDIVETVVDRIRLSVIFDDFGYIRTLRWVKHKMVQTTQRHSEQAINGGVDEMKFNITQDTTNSHLLHKYDLMKMELGVDWLTVQYWDLRKPLCCGQSNMAVHVAHTKTFTIKHL